MTSRTHIKHNSQIGRTTWATFPTPGCWISAAMLAAAWPFKTEACALVTSRQSEIMTAVRTHRAKLPRVQLNYAEAGASDAPALFLLHGWARTWREWSLVIPALAERYRVVAPDHGLSGGPR